jgi:hypothetical protein
MELKRFLLVTLLYLWFVSIVLALFIKETPPFSFFNVADFTLFIEESKLFFISIIFPLMIGKTIQKTLLPNHSFSTGMITYFIAFIILYLPLTIATSYFGGIGFNILFRANLLLLFITLFFIFLSSKSSPRSFDNYLSIYYLIFFVIFGAMPVLYYLVMEFTKQSWWILIAINPFWLFWQIKQADTFYSAWLLQCLIWIGIIISGVFIKMIASKLMREAK